MKKNDKLFNKMRRFARKKTFVSMRFIKKHNVTFDNTETLAAYNHFDNKIFLLDDLRICNKDFAAYVFAHEIGHAIDKQTNYSNFMEAQHAMNFVENCLHFKTKIPKKVAKLVITTEALACFYGEKFLKEININIKNIEQFRNDVIDTYKDLLNLKT